MKITATCGHHVSEGISTSVRDGRDTNYGTFCHHCILGFYKNDLLLNDELIGLIEVVQSNARKEVVKELAELRESNKNLEKERDSLLRLSLGNARPSTSGDNFQPAKTKLNFIAFEVNGKITHLNRKNIFRFEMLDDDEIEVFYNTGSSFHSMIAKMREDDYFEIINLLNEE